MERRSRLVFWLLVFVATAAGGYVWWDHARNTAEANLEDNLAALNEPVVKPLKATRKPLKLKLVTDEIFPLRKIVEETVTQGNIQSKTRLELLLSLRVMEIKEKRTRLRVDYQRVRYWQDIAGEKLTFDSDNPPRVLAPDVQAFSGLVKNGFEFWVGADNRMEIVDYEGFLRRCVDHVPESQRAEVLTRLLKTSGEEAVANFVDDSIGLLPFENRRVKRDDEWVRKRQILRPVPLFLTQTCRLDRWNGDLAEISIKGEIVPSTAVGPSQQPNGGLQVLVTGGESFGSCRIRRKTGLPELSDIRRVYNMIVYQPGGQRFRQKKETRTRIEVFEPQGSPKTIKVSAQTPIGGSQHR